MPLVNGEDFVEPTLAKKKRIRPSSGPKSTSAFRDRSSRVKSDYEVAMRHYEDVVNTLFKFFQAKYKKRYVSKREHETRKDIYRHNLR